MVQTKGLEATLHELRQAGVCVTFEEYKGRKSVVRSGKVIQINNESDVIETVMEALKHSSVAAHLAGELWKQAQTLRVKRQEPIWTARGKFMPLHKDKLSRRETKDASS
jgi:hypothetical protein